LSQSEEKFDEEGFECLKKLMEEYEARLRERLGKFSINDVKAAEENQHTSGLFQNDLHFSVKLQSTL
jgi:hypothetical protein